VNGLSLKSETAAALSDRRTSSGGVPPGPATELGSWGMPLLTPEARAPSERLALSFSLGGGGGGPKASTRLSAQLPDQMRVRIGVARKDAVAQTSGASPGSTRATGHLPKRLPT
jgi:hypothetical protein